MAILFIDVNLFSLLRMVYYALTSGPTPGARRLPILKANNTIDLFVGQDVQVLPGEKVELDLGICFELPSGVCGVVCLAPHVAQKYNIHIFQTILGE